MGMTSDQNELLSFSEQQEIKRKEEAERSLRNITSKYSALGLVTFNGKKYLLLAGVNDHKWYKAEFIKNIRWDERNHSPLRSIFSDEITPVTEEEFYTWFKKSA